MALCWAFGWCFRPKPEEEWPPLQEGALSRLVRVRFESPASWHGWDSSASKKPCQEWYKMASGHCYQTSGGGQGGWRTGRCRRLAGRRFNPQQGGGVEAGAVGQIRDRRKVSTSVTGTRASTAARAPRRGRRAGLCGREGIPHAPANGSAWARGQRGRG